MPSLGGGQALTCFPPYRIFTIRKAQVTTSNHSAYRVTLPPSHLSEQAWKYIVRLRRDEGESMTR
jgi:hypothetical protein